MPLRTKEPRQLTLLWARRRGEDTAPTLVDAKAVALNTLSQLVGEPDPILVAFQSLALELTQDVLEVSVEIAPVIPINFVLSTIHLVTVPLAA